ncbi:RNA-directed DNA polymerase, eukaryota [Tanacetum coccineum]
MEKIDDFCVQQCWGNLASDHVHSDAVGSSGGILCIWDPHSFCKSNVTVSDYFVISRGQWRLTGQKMMIIAVYAPQDSREKQSLWDYLQQEIGKWKGEVIIMGDFNEVRFKSDRFGSIFNSHGAHRFNSFISQSGLVEVTLGGSHFTWCHKSATKMSKLDRFLVSESVLSVCPNINAITLERYLSDHRPILLRENHYDYGPTPFRFFHHWLEMDGFSKLVEDTWKGSPWVGHNAMTKLMGKLRFLKKHIREWNKSSMMCRKNIKAQLKKELEAVDLIIDSGKGTDEVIRTRVDIIHKLQSCDKIDSMEMAQKAKIKWAVEGDENSGFFHGTINKRRSILNIRGVMVDGTWIDSPKKVKKEFFDHFSNRFSKPGERTATLHMEFPNQIHDDQRNELECEVTNDEIKKAVWECGTDKAPGPDGFTFGFLRHFWYLVEMDVYDAVRYFFLNNDIPQGCNSSFIALIPKIPNANIVKDFRPISLIGRVYKIIAKILTNRLVGVLGGIVNEVQSAFIKDRQILDGPFILNEVLSWRLGMILLNGLGRESTPIGKLKMLSIGGRLTLVKSVLGSMPIFHMSMFKVPSGILRILESIRCHFFNGHDMSSKKVSWVQWNKVLAPKDKGGLGLSRLFLWGGDGRSIGVVSNNGTKSVWMNIVSEINVLSKKGINLMEFLRIKLGNGESTLFWEDSWCEGVRIPRGGVEDRANINRESFLEIVTTTNEVFLKRKRVEELSYLFVEGMSCTALEPTCGGLKKKED